MIDAVVFGNVTLDVICQTVNEVPRTESVSFDNVIVSPGGCASNVAVGLGALGIKTALVCKIGDDDAGQLIVKTWQKFGLDLRWMQVVKDVNTAVSIGLVDDQAQPRFVHTPGANAGLTIEALMPQWLVDLSVKNLHIAGFFVLPGFLDPKLPGFLQEIRQAGIITSLDVVNTKRYWKPEFLWPCLPELDYFLCNRMEAIKLAGLENPQDAGRFFLDKGARNAIIKLGGEGCLHFSESGIQAVLAPTVDVVDTTGAGDAFAAGFLAALVNGKSILDACQAGNAAGAKIVGKRGAISAWN